MDWLADYKDYPEKPHQKRNARSQHNRLRAYFIVSTRCVITKAISRPFSIPIHRIVNLKIKK